jgi:hypothetical protein
MLYVVHNRTEKAKIIAKFTQNKDPDIYKFRMEKAKMIAKFTQLEQKT